MLETAGRAVIQGMPIERGNATSPYTVLSGDSAIEFTEGGDVTVTLKDDTVTTTTVLAGSRYAIGREVKTFTVNGTFSVA